jgi:hypothetical protein
VRIGLLVAALLGSSCGQLAQGPTVFSTQPSQTQRSASGALTITVFEPVDRPLSRGVNALKLLVEGDAGLEPAALSMTMTTWMPAMGHGSGVTPTVAPIDGGFVTTNISLPMAGRWDLRCTFEGELTDHATLSYDIQ